MAYKSPRFYQFARCRISAICANAFAGGFFLPEIGGFQGKEVARPLRALTARFAGQRRTAIQGRDDTLRPRRFCFGGRARQSSS